LEGTTVAAISGDSSVDVVSSVGENLGRGSVGESDNSCVVATDTTVGDSGVRDGFFGIAWVEGKIEAQAERSKVQKRNVRNILVIPD
jgi:hypothetical protein